MPTPITSEEIVGWALKAAGAIILFLLSLGIKDIRDRVKKSEELCIQVDSLYQLAEQKFRVLDERTRLIEERIRAVEERIRLIEEKVTRLQVLVDGR